MAARVGEPQRAARMNLSHSLALSAMPARLLFQVAASCADESALSLCYTNSCSCRLFVWQQLSAGDSPLFTLTCHQALGDIAGSIPVCPGSSSRQHAASHKPTANVAPSVQEACRHLIAQPCAIKIRGQPKGWTSLCPDPHPRVHLPPILRP